MLIGLIRQDGALQLKEEAIAEAQLFGQVDGYSLPIITRMFAEHTAKSPSASQIAGQAYRRTVLEKIISFYAKPLSLMAMLRGTLIHAGLQSTNLQGIRVITEHRYTYTIPGTTIKLSGQVDVYYPEHRRLEDYKTCQNIPQIIKEEHVLQLAIYYWLLRWNGLPVDKAVIDYISWGDTQQLSLAEMPDGSVNDVVMHPYFKDESYFVETITKAWHILNDGFEEYYVPGMNFCNRSYCRYCTLKWACDRIDYTGEIIEPSEFVQERGE